MNLAKLILLASPRSALWMLTVMGFAIASLLVWPLPMNAERPAISRRPLEHRDYDEWNTISSSQISPDGKWAMYLIDSGKIDGESILRIRSTTSTKEFSIERGSRGQFSYDSRYAVFLLTPDTQAIEALEHEKVEADQMPKAKLQILDLAIGNYITIDRVASFAMPEENSDWIGYQMEEPIESKNVKEKPSGVQESYEVTSAGLQRPEQKFKLKKRESLQPLEQNPKEETSETGRKTKRESTPSVSEPSEEKKTDKDQEKEKAKGTTLVLRNLAFGIEQTFPNVARFAFAKNGRTMARVTSVKVENKSKKADDEIADHNSNQLMDGVDVLDLESLHQTRVLGGVGEYKNLTFNDDGTQLAFITNRDDYDAKTSSWSVYHWTKSQRKAKSIATERTKGIPDGWWVATNSNQRFTEDGRRLYFETAPIPESVTKERDHAASKKDLKKDDEDEQVKLDVWHWQDPYLQPQQLLQADAERKRDYLAVFDIKSKRILQLATRQMPDVQIDVRSKSARAIAVTEMDYRKVLSWESPGFQDTYLINLDSGKRERVQQSVRWTARLSPEGRHVYWFDAERHKWFTQSTSSGGNPIEVTAGIGHSLENELHDRPSLPGAYGTAGWTKDDKALLVYDRYDIWQVDPTGRNAPIRLTNGRENKIRFRYRRLDAKERFIDTGNAIVLSAFDETTKASGFYRLTFDRQLWNNSALGGHDDRDGTAPRRLIMLDESISDLQKAQSSDDVIFTRSTFQMFPDLWSCTLEFESINRISDVNPQQHDYAWGTAELVHWKASDGQSLDGILYRPDGFDSATKYPMLVYFYERNSDQLHRYHTPAAGRASINVSFYVSRGYVVFIPDIPYKTGEPGNSAANAILSGVNSVVAKGFIDEHRIGMQGHSWGGYQTAYLVTQTDLFACAESGAPVSNMTSAYGGIRWSSGKSRMFQYERTQSRIGDDLWAARDKYIANSPLFFADKVNTPLLILHNDNDGAVPWYQGIELFVALRRLEKPAWMLNYNGNSHGVDGQPNRRDFAIRMQQFFDHYLKGAPEPEWMAVGIPAVKKGKELGLELLEPVVTEE